MYWGRKGVTDVLMDRVSPEGFCKQLTSLLEWESSPTVGGRRASFP